MLRRMYFIRKILSIFAKIYYKIKVVEPVIISGEQFQVIKSQNYSYWKHFTRNKLIEPEIFLILKEYLNEGDVFFDIGAFVGSHSLYASRKVGRNGQVFSFEPNPFNAQELRKNILLNGIENISVFQIALGGSNRKFDFCLPKRHGDKTSFLINCNSANKISVDERTLKSFAEEQEVSPCLIKIDVEGFEYEIFKGSESYFINNKPNTICEIHLELLTKEKIEYLFNFFHYYPKVRLVSGIDLPGIKKWENISLEDVLKSKMATITVFLTS